MPYASEEDRKAYHKAYYEKNRAEWTDKYKAGREADIAARDKAMRLADPERFKKYRKDNPQIARKATAKWRQNNPGKIREYERNRRATDMNYRLRGSLRARLRGACRNAQKGGSFVRDLGCTIAHLIIYLEERFADGMSWNNYGSKTGQWSIDHIVPLSLFNLQDRQHFLLACHYGNLQPMWHMENISKGNRS